MTTGCALCNKPLASGSASIRHISACLLAAYLAAGALSQAPLTHSQPQLVCVQDVFKLFRPFSCFHQQPLPLQLLWKGHIFIYQLLALLFGSSLLKAETQCQSCFPHEAAKSLCPCHCQLDDSQGCVEISNIEKNEVTEMIIAASPEYHEGTNVLTLSRSIFLSYLTPFLHLTALIYHCNVCY